MIISSDRFANFNKARGIPRSCAMAASDASGAPAIAAALAAPTCLNKARRETSRGALSSVGLAMDFLQFFVA
jgi:hypothetical protein